ncbi:hypothetical protein R3P38DRAFT_2554224, partial [Favolaschia claudopus]
GSRKNAATLRADFERHQCTSACLILKSEAMQAGITSSLILSPAAFQESALILNLRLGSIKMKQKPADDSASESNKCARKSAESSTPHTEFPIMLSQTEKDKIVSEFRDSTDNKSLKRYECSFCGKLEYTVDVKMRSVNDLDISLLERAVENLREVCSQPCIKSYKSSSLIDESIYALCHLCNLSVTHNKFQTIPLRSYANGLWIGEVPPELQGLTFLEEQCIARARATKCMYKISLGPTGQLAARGNVCILPQDTSSFCKGDARPAFQTQRRGLRYSRRIT